MNLNTLAQGEPWMTHEERGINRVFLQDTAVLLAARGVPESPLVMLRVNDIITTWLLARRLESALAPDPGEPAPCPTPAQAGAIGKCRDRLRRAMKDFETCCPRDTTPAGLGIFECLQQVEARHAERSPANGNARETRTAESTPSETPNPSKTTKPEAHNPEPSENRDSVENCLTPSITTNQSETPANTELRNPPPALTTQPENPPTSRHKPTKKRRKKRGIPKRPRAS